jgi:hypothetical protein
MRERGRWAPWIGFTHVEFQWKVLFFLGRTCAVRLRVIIVSRSELASVFAFSFHHRISLLFSSWIGCSIRFPLRACAVSISSLICCWRLFFRQFPVRWVLPHSHKGIRPGHHPGFVVPPVFFLGCFSLLSAGVVGVPAGSDVRAVSSVPSARSPASSFSFLLGSVLHVFPSLCSPTKTKCLLHKFIPVGAWLHFGWILSEFVSQCPGPEDLLPTQTVFASLLREDLWQLVLPLILMWNFLMLLVDRCRVSPVWFLV